MRHKLSGLIVRLSAAGPMVGSRPGPGGCTSMALQLAGESNCCTGLVTFRSVASTVEAEAAQLQGPGSVLLLSQWVGLLVCASTIVFRVLLCFTEVHLPNLLAASLVVLAQAWQSLRPWVCGYIRLPAA
eukprot:GHUV01014260.1.p1 GENE.GHUV01014260.1~~GHUV01014260.1.p1  ORF type:complete len:129 (+),score=16.51 GHUV01014260.1:400-786(+)